MWSKNLARVRGTEIATLQEKMGIKQEGCLVAIPGRYPVSLCSSVEIPDFRNILVPPAPLASSPLCTSWSLKDKQVAPMPKRAKTYEEPKQHLSPNCTSLGYNRLPIAWLGQLT